MKTIELNCGGTVAQFTTKSVTFNGTEYFYSNMTDVSNNINEHFYTFTYKDEIIKLPYEEKDIKILAAIFNQVQTLIARKAASQTKAVPEKSTVNEPGNSLPSKSGGNTLKDSTSIGDKSNTEQPADAEAPQVSKEEPKTSGPSEDAEKVPEPSEDTEKAPEPSEDAEKAPADPEKKRKIKKSFIIFGIVIIVFAAAAAIVYAVFGSSDSSSQITPNVTETQQYDDIDDIINDLQ